MPQHLIVVGGGYIGLELGSVWARLGSKVTVLEFLPRILPLSDAEIAEALHRSLVKQGLTFHLETKVTRAGAQGGEVVVHGTSKGKDLEFRCDKVLVAVGRRPYVTGLGLKEAGVTADEKSGKVQMDEDFETNVMLTFYRRYLPERPALTYYEHDSLPPGGTEWILLETIVREPQPKTRIRRAGSDYDLVEWFPYRGPSGLHWFLYRRAS